MYFIDVSTGTWGYAEDIRIVSVEEGAESAMLVNTLDNLSDDQICEWGETYGTRLNLD